MSEVIKIPVSLFSPILLAAFLLFSEWFLKTKFLEIVFALIYFEHLYLGHFLGVDLDKNSGGGFFPMPYNKAFFKFVLLFDYLLIAFLVYALLTVFTKHILADQEFS